MKPTPLNKAPSRTYVKVPNGTTRLAIFEVEDVNWRLRYVPEERNVLALTAASIIEEYLHLLYSTQAAREGVVAALKRAHR